MISNTAFYFVMGAIYGPMLLLLFKIWFSAWRWMRKNKVETAVKECIQKDWATKAAMIGLITEQIEKDWMFRRAITQLVIEKIGEDWELKQAIIKAVNQRAA